METLKSAVFIGCILAIAFTMIEIIIPDKNIFKNVKLVMSLILLISIVTPVLKEGVVISVSAYQSEAEACGSDLQQKLDEAYIKEIENEITKSLELYFIKNEIDVKKLVIVTQVDEYNYLEVQKVNLEVSEENKRKSENILRELLGENITVEFYDENE